MNNRWALIAILSAVVGCQSMHAKHHEEEEEDEQNEVKMSIDQVPPAVKATIMEAAAGATVGSVDKEENSKGMFTYETDVKSPDGKNWEIRVSPDGKLISKKIDEEDEKPAKKDDDEKEEHENEVTSHPPASSRIASCRRLVRHPKESGTRITPVIRVLLLSASIATSRPSGVCLSIQSDEN